MSAWKFKHFRFHTYAALLFSYATQSQTMIVGWQIYEIKRDPLYLGFIGLTEALPALSLALVAGYIVDHANPLKIYRNMIRLLWMNAALLLAVSGPWFGLTNDVKVPLLYGAAFLAGTARGFRMPTVTALVPQLVPREALQVSTAWNTSAFSIASAMGPAVAGFLYAWKGAAAPYVVNLILLSVSLFLAQKIRTNYVPHVRKKASAVFENLTAGLRYVVSHGLLLPALALDMFAVLFGGVLALLPVFSGEILHVGAAGVGLMRAAVAGGTLLGSLSLIRFPIRRHSGKVLLVCVACFGLCMVGFGLSKYLWLSVALLGLGGIFDGVSMVIRGTIVQLSAPPEMRGRVGAVNSVFIGVSNQLGEFESGVAAKLLGTVPSVVFGGIVTLLVVLITALKAPKLRKMEIADL